MLCKIVLLAAAFQVGPFCEQRQDAAAVRPFWSREGETTDALWPLFTAHRDWWRLGLFSHYQENDRSYQFDILPLWWNGVEEKDGVRSAYCGLFPIAGYHPHVAALYDFEFSLWPCWMSYRRPRPAKGEWLTTYSVLWPFFHYRTDGSWGFWPFYVCNHQRESFHQTALWPLVTWAAYAADRDTAGAGTSWMAWPLVGRVARERESQWLVFPPLFSSARTADGAWRLRAPWPLVDYEDSPRRWRLSCWPFYEKSVQKPYGKSEKPVSVTRFGWKLVELYGDETRVFPFWVSRRDEAYFRLWPFWESSLGRDGVRRGRFLSIFPIRHVPAVDRNWAKFWTFYECADAGETRAHSLFWGIISWRTSR